jgi:hypothetical protein
LVAFRYIIGLEIEAPRVMNTFEIETFQLGQDQWHACFRLIARSKPIVIDGIALGVINVGFAWPTPDAALKDAQTTSNE